MTNIKNFTKYFTYVMIFLMPTLIYAETWHIISKKYISEHTEYKKINKYVIQPRFGAQNIQILPIGDFYFTTYSPGAGEWDSNWHEYLTEYYICYYNHLTDSITNLSLKYDPGIPQSTRIRNMETDDTGNLYVATWSQWILKWDNLGKKWSKYRINDSFADKRIIEKVRFFDNKLYALSMYRIDNSDSPSYFEISVLEDDSLSIIHSFSFLDWKKTAEDFWLDNDNSFWLCGWTKFYGGVWKLNNNNEMTEYDIMHSGNYNATYLNPNNITGDENFIYVGVPSAKMIGDFSSQSTIAVLDKQNGSLIKIIKYPGGGGKGVSKIIKIGNTSHALVPRVGFSYLKDLDPYLIDFPNEVKKIFLDTLVWTDSVNGDTTAIQIIDEGPKFEDFDYLNGSLAIAGYFGIIYTVYEDPLGIKKDNVIQNVIDIYPNILTNGIRDITIVSNEGIEIRKIQLINIRGDILFDDIEPLGYIEGESRLKIPNISSGRYFILFETNKGSFISPIILFN